MNMLENVEKSYVNNSGAGIVASMVALTLGIILAVAVVIPITNDVIDEANLNGTSATVVGVIPIFVALIPLVLVAGFVQ